MKRTIVVLLAVLAALVSCGDDSTKPKQVQKGAISGEVADRIALNPIAGAIISTSPVTVSDTSDVTGAFMINAVPAGTYTVTATMPGFWPGSLDGEVTGGDTLVANINLVPEPPAGPTAYYPFNGNASDESGNGNDGTVQGPSLAQDRFGDSGSAYSFDGLNDTIGIGDGVKPDLPFSLSMWVYLNRTGDPPMGIFRNDMWDGNDSYHGVYLMVFGSVLRCGLGSGGAGPGTRVEFDATVSMPVGSWQHVVYVFAEPIREAGNIKLYVGGDEVGLADPAGDGSTMTYSSFDGVLGDRMDQFFDGLIDDVRVYPRALTMDEVLTLFYERGWED